jgi:hypothetical protein
MDGKKRRNWARTFLTGVSIFVASAYLHAVPVRTVTISWHHAPGPYSYNVYESNKLPRTPADWMLNTNVTALNVQIDAQANVRYYTVTCLDTNNGLESSYATP